MVSELPFHLIQKFRHVSVGGAAARFPGRVDRADHQGCFPRPDAAGQGDHSRLRSQATFDRVHRLPDPDGRQILEPHRPFVFCLEAVHSQEAPALAFLPFVGAATAGNYIVLLGNSSPVGLPCQAGVFAPGA